jgi:hypothetical protein
VNFPKNLSESIRTAPFAWSMALVAAALPFGVVAWKGSARSPSPQPVVETAAHARASSSGGVSEWFSGADNPFLTEEQARERRMRAAVARVEEVLRRRPDVRDVTILTSSQADGRGASAVVSIAMREGVVPVQLVDAAGTLLCAAVPGLKAEQVTVIDETSGIRALACALGAEGGDDGRAALASAQVPVRAAPAAPVVAPSAPSVSSAGWPSWLWAAGAAAAVGLAWAVWFWRTRRVDVASPLPEVGEEDPIAGTLSMALHRQVAEQGTLITTALVERLEQGAPANEVAQLLLSLEPWAAERVLKGMPPEALAKVEEALRDPAHDAPMERVRALAEAVLSVRMAA